MYFSISVWSSWRLFKVGKRYIETSRKYENVRKTYEEVLDVDQNDREGGDVESVMASINPNYIAWLKIEDTSIDYPIVHGESEVYLVTDFQGEESISGTLFVSTIQNPFKDRNTVIFGHNMKDGSMFGGLKKYLQKGFYKNHKTIQINYNGRNEEYTIFSVQIVGENDDRALAYTFQDSEEYSEFLQIMEEKSLVETHEKPGAESSIVTLSTCHGTTNRLIIQAYKEEEEEEEKK